ncbi:ferredoxin [Corynebacterium halotolerans]|uniref:ferredoxin n=1 Tax=Corynebacterium halotolerans TaxID=225326 RepID=UPI003CF3DA46
MKVIANYDTCIASGNCGYIAPNVFRNLDEHGGFVSVADEHPPEAELSRVQRAERLCPSATIRVEEGGGR